MQNLYDHIALAILMSALISGVLENIKRKLNDHNVLLSSLTWLMISVIVSVAIPIWLTQYYLAFTLMDSINIAIITVLGAQAFYTVFLQKSE